MLVIGFCNLLPDRALSMGRVVCSATGLPASQQDPLEIVPPKLWAKIIQPKVRDWALKSCFCLLEGKILGSRNSMITAGGFLCSLVSQGACTGQKAGLC